MINTNFQTDSSYIQPYKLSGSSTKSSFCAIGRGGGEDGGEGGGKTAGKLKIVMKIQKQPKL